MSDVVFTDFDKLNISLFAIVNNFRPAKIHSLNHLHNAFLFILYVVRSCGSHHHTVNTCHHLAFQCLRKCGTPGSNNCHLHPFSSNCAQIMFESFHIPALYISNETTLALFGHGKVSGTVVMMGHSTSYVAAVSEGYTIDHLTEHLPACMTGCGMDLQLRQQLRSHGVASDALPTSVLERIRLLFGNVAQRGTHSEELEKANRLWNIIGASALQTSTLAKLAEIKSRQVEGCLSDIPTDDLDLLAAECALTTEEWFTDSPSSPDRGDTLGTKIAGVMSRSQNQDQQVSATSCLLVTGGCSGLSGFKPRLRSELGAILGADKEPFCDQAVGTSHLQPQPPKGRSLRKFFRGRSLSSPDATRISGHEADGMSMPVLGASNEVESLYGVWAGGSIAASMPDLQWITRKEFCEEGGIAVKRKCY